MGKMPEAQNFLIPPRMYQNSISLRPYSTISLSKLSTNEEGLFSAHHSLISLCTNTFSNMSINSYQCHKTLKYFRLSDPYFLHFNGNTYIFKGLKDIYSPTHAFRV